MVTTRNHHSRYDSAPPSPPPAPPYRRMISPLQHLHFFIAGCLALYGAYCFAWDANLWIWEVFPEDPNDPENLASWPEWAFALITWFAWGQIPFWTFRWLVLYTGIVHRYLVCATFVSGTVVECKSRQLDIVEWEYSPHYVAVEEYAIRYSLQEIDFEKIVHPEQQFLYVRDDKQAALKKLQQLPHTWTPGCSTVSLYALPHHPRAAVVLRGNPERNYHTSCWAVGPALVLLILNEVLGGWLALILWILAAGIYVRACLLETKDDDSLATVVVV